MASDPQPELSHPFRVTVEDLETGTREAVEFAKGDYLLLVFEPCHRANVQVHPTKGTHVITVKEYGPRYAARSVDG